jgi:biotin synthase
MGAAWREVKDGPAFDNVLEMVRGVRALGMEACVTLGMLNDDQAKRLKQAGLTAYNHNLDTSRSIQVDHLTRTVRRSAGYARSGVRRAGTTVSARAVSSAPGESIDDRCESCARWRRSIRSRSRCRSTRSSPPRAPLSAMAPSAARAGAHDRHRAHLDAAVARARLSAGACR